MKGKLIILCGISGSGKSSYAHEMWAGSPDEFVIVNRDKVRELLFGYTEATVEKYYALPKLGKYEKQVTRYCDTLINDGLQHDKTVIIDATNLTVSYINAFTYWNVPTEIITIDVGLDVAIFRDSRRVRKVGSDIIEKQYARFQTLKRQLSEDKIADFSVKTIEMNEDNQPCYIFDIDGTIAHMDRDVRSPYDWDKVDTDTIDEPTAAVMSVLKELGIPIIICTGRDGAALEKTKEWLIKHGLFYDKIYIREKGDMRADWIVKEEMWREIAEDYYIMGMFDDRLQVVRRARALGLKVFNVEYHNF